MGRKEFEHIFAAVGQDKFDVIALGLYYGRCSIVLQGKHGQAGFPPIREIREFRENFEDFFQSGKSGKNRGFSAKIRELFFQTIFKPFKPINLRKMFFKTVKPQELSGNCNICID